MITMQGGAYIQLLVKQHGLEVREDGHQMADISRVLRITLYTHPLPSHTPALQLSWKGGQEHGLRL